MQPLKATREQLKRHNQQILLRAVYSGLADNRAALAQITNLAKPTVSDLVAELIDGGLLEETGRGESGEGGGKRPTLLRFVPSARQVIGVALDGSRVLGVLSNLDGEIIAQHALNAPGNDSAIVPLIEAVINALIAQQDAPLLCVGLALPGVVDSANGRVTHTPYPSLHSFSLVDHLQKAYRVPVVIGSNSEVAALAQFAFGFGQDTPTNSLAMLMINHTVEVGVALAGATYHHGGNIGSLRLSADSATVEQQLAWHSVLSRIAQLRAEHPACTLPTHDLTYIHIRYHAEHGDAVAQIIMRELSSSLAGIMAWMIALLNPHHIALAGAIVNLGEGFLQTTVHNVTALIAHDLVQNVTFSLAYSGNLSAIGAVANAIQKELGIL